MNRKYYARGKLLITSEYMILHGAKALALPLQLGQSMLVEPHDKQETLSWTARTGDKTWFSAEIATPGLQIIETSDTGIAERLIYILQKSLEIDPHFIHKLQQTSVTTILEFQPEWGFGSSSTLTSLIAQWAGIDAMQLHFRISRGSGYDVACATAASPQLYQIIKDMPVVESVDFYPEFVENLWFIYLGAKQTSEESIKIFFSEYEPLQQDIDAFSKITCELLHASTLEEFGRLMEQHENRLADILKTPSIGKNRFEDLDGYVKSLGAWGGDFALLATRMNKKELEQYLLTKNITLFFSFKELAYNE